MGGQGGCSVSADENKILIHSSGRKTLIKLLIFCSFKVTDNATTVFRFTSWLLSVMNKSIKD